MHGLLTDVNIEGHVRMLRRHLDGPEWCGLWQALQTPILSFADVGLSPEASDEEVWRLCQAQELVLVTANRNDDAPDSLTAVMDRESSNTSLPVFTLASAERIRRSKLHAERVVESLLSYLIDIDQYRGTRRLFLP